MDIRRWFLSNLGLKISALLLALQVWAMVAGKERAYAERSFEIRAETVHLPGKMDIQSIRPDRVSVTLRGRRNLIQKITATDLHLRLDLEGELSSGTRSYFAEDCLLVPPDLEVVSLVPKTIRVTLERLESIEVPVRILYSGHLPEGVELMDRVVKPEKVRIFGLESQIRSISTVYGQEKVALEQFDRTRTVRISLRKEQEILRFEGADQVEVTVVVRNRTPEGSEGEKH